MTDNEIEDVEIRKVQALTGERSFVLVLAKQFARELGISKGEFFEMLCSGWQAHSREN
ncbi:MAG: hypothetical protein ACJ71X_09275 [Nitrososphaeraceae archaeon]